LGVVGDLQPVHDEVIFHWALDGFPIGPFDANRRVDPQSHRFDHNVAALLATFQAQVDVARRRVVAGIAIPIWPLSLIETFLSLPTGASMGSF
jgi:hypothetical protein